MANISQGDKLRQEGSGAAALGRLVGDLIYVDSTNGNNGNKGSYDHPVKTLTRAVALAQAGDTILLEAGGSETVTAAISIAVANLKVLCPVANAKQGFTISGAGTLDLITVSAAGVHIEGLDLQHTGATANQAGIRATNAAHDLVIKGCVVDDTAVTTKTGSGIELVPGCRDQVVEDCEFLGLLYGILFVDSAGTYTRSVIKGCRMNVGESAGFGIMGAAATCNIRGFRFMGNAFYEANGDGSAATAAWDGTNNANATQGPIQLGANADQGLISGNWAYEARGVAFDTLNAINAGAAVVNADNKTGTSSDVATAVASVGTKVGSVGTQTGSVGTQVGSVGTLVGSVGTQATSLGTQATSVGTLVTSVGTQATSIGTLVGSVGTYLSGTIKVGVDSVGTQAGSVGTLVASVGTQAGSLGTQVTSVGTQTASVGTQAASVGTQVTSVGTQTASVGTQAASVGTQVTSVGTQTASVGTQAASVGTQVASVGTQAASLGTQATSVGTQVTSVGTLTTSVGTQATSLGTQIAGVAAWQTTVVSKASISLADGAIEDLFTVNNGPVALLGLILHVTAAVSANACNAKWQLDPTVGASNTDLCGLVDIQSAAQGDVFYITGASASAMIKAANGTAVPLECATAAVLMPGGIDLSLANADPSTGTATAYLLYRPLASNATVTAAA